MATFHGGWSLGACAGALIGFVMILAGVSPIWHYTLIFIIILIIVTFRAEIFAGERTAGNGSF